MAKEHPRYAHVEWPEWEFNEYPKMVYPGAEDQKKPYDSRGRPLPGVTVNSAEEEAEVLGMEPPTPVVAEKRKARLVPGAGGAQRLATEADDRAEIIEEAAQKGVTIDKSWSIARIRDAIDSAAEAVV